MMEIEQMDESKEIMHLPISWEEKGKKAGKIEGENKARREVALEMVKEGASIEFIVKVTRLDREEVAQLIKRIEK